MTKFGTPDRVDGPGNASTNPGLLGAGDPSGRRILFPRLCRRRLTFGRASRPPVSVDLLRFRDFLFFFFFLTCVRSPWVLGCSLPPFELGGGVVVVSEGEVCDGWLGLGCDGVPGATGVPGSGTLSTEVPSGTSTVTGTTCPVARRT